jgi:hypothetical protein
LGKKGKIPSLKIGKSIRYNWHSVIEAIDNQSNKNIELRNEKNKKTLS